VVCKPYSVRYKCRAPSTYNYNQTKKSVATEHQIVLPLRRDKHAKIWARLNFTCYLKQSYLDRFPGSQISRQSTYEGGKVVSPTHWPPLPPRKYSWYSFLLEAESTPGSQCGRKGCQWKNSSGNRTRYLPACSSASTNWATARPFHMLRTIPILYDTRNIIIFISTFLSDVSRNFFLNFRPKNFIKKSLKSSTFDSC
jgi:hypothetical protein